MTVYGVIQLQQIIDLFKKYKTVFSCIKDVLLIDALDQHHYSHTDHDSMVSFASLPVGSRKVSTNISLASWLEPMFNNAFVAGTSLLLQNATKGDAQRCAYMGLDQFPL